MTQSITRGLTPLILLGLLLPACAELPSGVDAASPPLAGGAASADAGPSDAPAPSKGAEAPAEEAQVDPGPYPIVLAHGMFGTERFANLVDYWYGIPEALAEAGEQEVFVTTVDPLNDSTVRGAQLEAQVEQILADTGHQRVILIGHSQGGLDARVVAFHRPELVAAVVTIGTPHGGSPLGQAFLNLLDNPVASPLVGLLEELLGPIVYDDAFGPDTDLYKSLNSFTEEGAAAFNREYPTVAGVAYYSIAGISSLASTEVPECEVPGGAPEFIARWSGERDPLIELALLEPLISPLLHPIAHDGMVPVNSQVFDGFLGCIPADHLDEVGQLFGADPGWSLLYGSNDFDYRAFYVELAAWLRAEGL